MNQKMSKKTFEIKLEGNSRNGKQISRWLEKVRKYLKEMRMKR